MRDLARKEVAWALICLRDGSGAAPLLAVSLAEVVDGEVVRPVTVRGARARRVTWNRGVTESEVSKKKVSEDINRSGCGELPPCIADAPECGPVAWSTAPDD